MSGRTDLPLSELGTRQVRLLASHLAQEPPFDCVYSSPLRRAVDTAKACVGRSHAEPHLCPGLQEIDCGRVDGVTIEHVQREYPELWARNMQQTDDTFAWPGGESYTEFRARCVAAIERIAAKHGAQRVAVVTHAGVISQVLGFIHGLRPASWEEFRPGNTALTEVLWQGHAGTVLYFDRVDHLADRAQPQ